jgi:Gas vesicle synthesis protein GvpL/GvpF
MAVYVYGIMRTSDARRAVRAAHADVGPELDTVEHGPVSAVASSLPEGQQRLRREDILAHSDVLQAVFRHGPVLPLRLGTALPDGDAVARDLLAPRAAALAARLDAVDHKAEMQVKAAYAEAPLLRAVLAADPALRQAVERNQGLPAAATHFEQLRIGEAIAAAVQARQLADGEALLSPLRPLASAVRLSPPHHERAAMNAAFLVEADELSRFDTAVEQLSRDRSGEIEFKLIGPLPPYSFADGELEAADRGKAGVGWG